MTRVNGMTLKQFGEMVEEMRMTYFFEDDEATIIETMHHPSASHHRLELHVANKEHDVDVVLMKEVENDESGDV